MKQGSNENMTMRKEIIIVDWDGCLQMIDKAWCYLVKTQEDKLSPWLDYSKLENYGTADFLVDLFNREEYYLDKWLLKDGIEKLPEGAYQFFMGLYSHCDFFYDGCDFLLMMDAMAGMAQQNYVSEIIILTHVPFTNGRDLRKEKIFEEKIKPISGKFKLVQLHTTQSKGEWIRDNKPDFTVFVDDNPNVIRDVVEKNSLFEKFIYMPIYGYNSHLLKDVDFITDLIARNCEMAVYQNQIIPGLDKLEYKLQAERDSRDLYDKLNSYLNKRSKEHFNEVEEIGKFDFQKE